MSSRALAAAVASLCVGVLTSCGGGGGSSSDLTLDAWRGQADAICVAARQQADASQPVTGAGNPAVPIRAQAALARSQADQLGALGSPDAEAATVDDLVESMERQADALDVLADALLADPSATSGVVGAAVTVETEKVTDAATTLNVASCTTQASVEPSPGEQAPGTDEGFGDGFATEDG